MENELKDEYDIIIVGGGVCGLIVGTTLQKEGFSTLIIEKASKLGGKCSELNWNGVRFDHFGKWDTVYGSNDPKDGKFYKACKLAGINLDFNQIHWQVGLLKKELKAPEYHSITDWSGGKALLEFARIMAGLEISEDQKKELMTTLDKMASYSYEELKKLTHLKWKDWVEENVKDDLVKMFFNLGNFVTDVPSDELSAANNFWVMGNLYKGKSVFSTVAGGPIIKTLIEPLENAARKSGVHILTDAIVREIVIKNDEVQSVWIFNKKNLINWKIKAKNIIINVPVYDAFPNLLKENMLTEDELKYVNRVKETNTGDLSCYFLLEKDTIKDLPGHFHGFDLTTGFPIYIGEIVQQKHFGAIVPDNYDYLQIYIPGGRDGGYLKPKEMPQEISFEKLEKAKNKMLKIVDKYMVPGFKSKIVKSGMTWSPNFGRYCMMAFDTNLGVKSKKINRLYFANDSVDCTCVGLLGLEKVGEVALRCIDTFKEDN